MKTMLSIVIVAYNNEKVIEECIKSVLDQKIECEIIVVDNNSSKQTEEIARKFVSVKYIDSGGNIGFSKGCNLGVRNCSGDLLLFLNPDTRVLPGSLQKLLDFAKEHPRFGIIAPRLLQNEGIPQPSVRLLPTITGVIKEYYLFQKAAYEGYVPSSITPIEVESVVGAAVLIRREVFIKVGEWDEKYFMYYEDLDLCRKINLLGLKIYYLPNVSFYHEVGGSSSTLKTKIIKESFYKYHGIFEGTLINLLLSIRPTNMVRILNKSLGRS